MDINRVSTEYQQSINWASTNVTTDAESIQLAYTIGGASIRYAEADVDNGSYNTGTAFDKDARVLSLALAF